MHPMKGDFTRDIYYFTHPGCPTGVVSQGAFNFSNIPCNDIDMKVNA